MNSPKEKEQEEQENKTISTDDKTVIVYIPENAKINESNGPMNPPETEYENVRCSFDRDVVKTKIVIGGRYSVKDGEGLD